MTWASDQADDDRDAGRHVQAKPVFGQSSHEQGEETRRCPPRTLPAMLLSSRRSNPARR